MVVWPWVAGCAHVGLRSHCNPPPVSPFGAWNLEEIMMFCCSELHCNALSNLSDTERVLFFRLGEPYLHAMNLPIAHLLSPTATKE
jgi:hypothetical protein